MRKNPIVLAAVLLGCTTARPEERARFEAVRTRADRAVILEDWPMDGAASVAPGVFRGAAPSKKELEFLREKGVRTVINLRTHHSEADDVRAAGLDSIEIPLRADAFGSRAPTEDEIDAFLDAVTDIDRLPAYVHCAHGVDRTGTMIALYRIEIMGWSNEDAVAEMLVFGYHSYYESLIDYVRNYRRRRP